MSVHYDIDLGKYIRNGAGASIIWIVFPETRQRVVGILERYDISAYLTVCNTYYSKETFAYQGRMRTIDSERDPCARIGPFLVGLRHRVVTKSYADRTIGY